MVWTISGDLPANDPESIMAISTKALGETAEETTDELVESVRS